MSNPLDLRYVFIGTEELGARPINWKYDDDGNPIEAVEYHTTCPKCSARVVFNLMDISMVEGKEHIQCKECKAGNAPKDQPANQELIDLLQDDRISPFVELPSDFDPVALYD